MHVDLWAATQLDTGAASSSVRRRLSAPSPFYRYCAAHDLVGRVPTDGVARPMVDPDYTATVGLGRDQARALVAAADADTGAQALRTAAVVRLLLHNALRVDEACAADIADLGEDSGHQMLRVVRKGARKAKIPLTPATVAALEAYLTARAERAGAGEWRQLAGPLLATAAGGRLRQGHLWELVRRLARTAGIGAWEQLSPHSLRHSAITFALDAGASLRDVQDYAGHKDPRTTRRYDHSRDAIGDIEPVVEARSWLARARLQLGDPAAALTAAAAGRELPYPAEEPALRLLEGLALLGLHRREESVPAFSGALAAADALLALADKNVAALQARALALAGLAAAAGDPARATQAGEAFARAGAVTGAAGVAADTRRLHDQIACHDQSGILARIRAAPDP